MDKKEAVNDLGVALQVGGAAASVENPIAGAVLTISGTFLSVLANKASKHRSGVFFSKFKEGTTSEKIEGSAAAMDIFDSCRKAILSQSDRAIEVMGEINDKALQENRKLTEIEVAAVDALSELNDYDIENFKDICTNSLDYSIKCLEGMVISEDKIPENLLFTAHKLVRIDIFKTTSNVVTKESLIGGTFYYFTSLGNYIKEMIEE